MKEIVSIQIFKRFKKFVGRVTWDNDETEEFVSAKMEEVLASMTGEIITRMDVVPSEPDEQEDSDEK